MKQKGFTLIELLVALAVGSLVIVSAVGVLYQVVWGTSRTNSQVVTLIDVHYAALQLKKDLVMAQLDKGDFPDGGTTVITLAPDDSTATLGWTDYTTPSDEFGWEEDRDHSSAYNLLSDGVLQRTYDGTISIVGRNITSVNFTQNGRVINVVITATAGDFTPRSETLEFSVYLRGQGIE